MQQKTNLNLLNVALMFVGAIMGAGFASGREIWQFFGVFGKQGRVGILLIAGAAAKRKNYYCHA